MGRERRRLAASRDELFYDAGFDFFFIKQPNGWSAEKISMAGLCQNHSQSREQWQGVEGGRGRGRERGVEPRLFFHTHLVPF